MARTITTEEFEHLYRSTAPELFGYLRRRAAPDPEDLVAEVYAIAWRRRADLPAAILRRAWLFGAARNLLLTQARGRGQQDDAIEHLAAFTAPHPQPGEQGEHGWEPIVHAALGRLAPHDRELILLVEWERMNPSEIAVMLGIRPGTARVRLHRARQALAADPELQTLIARRRVPGITPSPARS